LSTDKKGGDMYKKPYLGVFSCEELTKKIGVIQNQYDPEPQEPTTITLETTTGYNSGNSDGGIQLHEGEYSFEDVEVCLSGFYRNGDYYSTQLSLFGFDISDVTGTISSATLQVYTGTSQPNDNEGEQVVDHVDFGESIEAGANDFGESDGSDALNANIGRIYAGGETLELQEVDVTQYVQEDLDEGRNYSQYRIRFSQYNPGADGSVQMAIEDAEGHIAEYGYPGGSAPALVIEYQE